MKEKITVWVVTDDRAGNLAQALGLAEAIARHKAAEIVETPITLKPWAAAVPPGLSHKIGGWVRSWPGSGLASGAEQFQWPWPDIAIGAGRRSAPMVADLRRAHHVTAIQLLDPQMQANAFDAVIVPEHDDLAGGNVLSSVGALNRFTADTIAAAAEIWRAELTDRPSPRVAVLVGGPSKSSVFSAADQQNLVRALEMLAADFSLLITPSRRTPPELVKAMRERLAGRAMIWDGKGYNPYPAILGHADAVLVTEDSVNMASEAASTGLPVHCFALTRTDAKIARFHESLAARGAARRFRGQIETWTYEPLAEADRIVADLVRRQLI